MSKSVLFEIKMLQNVVARDVFKELKCESKRIPSLIQIEIIDYLARCKFFVCQKDLEKQFKLRRSTISGIIKTMEKNNYVRRIYSQEDLRSKVIILTDEALELLNDMREKLKRLEKKAIKGISDDKLEIFLEVIKDMQNNFL